MKVITDGTEQVINLLANDTPLQLLTFRHEVMPSSQSHQVINWKISMLSSSQALEFHNSHS